MKIPRPNEYVWLTDKFKNHNDFWNIELIRVDEIYYLEGVGEWIIYSNGNEYYADDCIKLEHDLVIEERVDTLN